MAVTSNVENAVLQFKIEIAKDTKGKSIGKNYSFSGINPQATPEIMFKAGNSLATLTGKTALAVYSIQKNLLSNAGA